jgi:DNA-binding SARP family transcriptional activator
MWAGRIVLVGRGLPQWIGNDADLSRQACLMPLASAHLLPDYFHRRMSQALLEVQVFGRGRVLVNGCVIEDWGGELPRALFFYFVDRGLVARDDIFQAFWPQMSIKEATNVFHVTKRKINQVLGLDLMVHGSGFYRIAPQIELIYDAAVFAEAVQNSAVATSQEAEDWLVQAIEVYQRDFLASWRETLPWVEQRRQTLKQTYGEALIALARLYEQKAQPQKALGFYARAFAVFPQREDVAGSLMRLYRDAHMEADVLEVYRKLRDGLAKELNISPARWLQELAGEKSIQSSETR